LQLERSFPIGLRRRWSGDNPIPSATTRLKYVSARFSSTSEYPSCEDADFIQFAKPSIAAGEGRDWISLSGTFKTGPRDRITARSIHSGSSRMLPGQWYWPVIF